MGEIPFIRDLNGASTNIKDLFGVETNPYHLISQHGVHLNCHYDLIVPIPKLVLDMIRAKKGTSITGDALAERINYYCTEVIGSTSSIASSQIRVGGEGIEIPYDRLYGELNTTFYVEGGYQEDGGMTYGLIEAWLNTIYPPITRNFAYPDEYTTSLRLALYTTPDANPLFGKEHIVFINYLEAWPTNIQSLNLTGRSNNIPSEFTVTWKYRYLITDDLGSNQSALGEMMDVIKNGFRVYRGAQHLYQDAKDTYSSLKDAWKSVKEWF